MQPFKWSYRPIFTNLERYLAMKIDYKQKKTSMISFVMNIHILTLTKRKYKWIDTQMLTMIHLSVEITGAVYFSAYFSVFSEIPKQSAICKN